MVVYTGQQDLVTQFYDVLIKNRRRRGKRALILCAPDVDALCSLKILLHLFNCDLIEYSLEICTSLKEMIEAMEAHRESIRHVICINCGSRENCMLELKPGNMTRVFVIDSRRPVHQRNLYDKQIFVFTNKFDAVDVPTGPQVYPNGDTRWDEDDSIPDDTENYAAVFKWRNERRVIVEEYLRQKTWFERSSALTTFDLAYTLGKDDSDLFFWAITGLCDLSAQHKIATTDFISEGVGVQGHLIRLLHSADTTNQQTLKISYHHDLFLRFYRQWSVFESLNNSPYTASVFRAWEVRGQKKLYEMLADMGFSLAQCQQSYAAMDLSVRTHMVDWFKEKGHQYDIQDISQATFLASYGFNQKFQVADMALGLFACLTVNDSSTPKDNFHEALTALEHGNSQKILPVLELGKRQLVVMRNIVQAAIEEKLFTGIQNMYFQASLDNLSTAGVRYIARPDVLIVLAHFLQRAYVVYQRGPRIRNLPFVLIAEIFGASGESSDSLYVVGLPELDTINSKDSSKTTEKQGNYEKHDTKQGNYMGCVFDYTAESANMVNEIERDTFHDYVVKIPKAKKATFLENLILGRMKYTDNKKPLWNERAMARRKNLEDKENGQARAKKSKQVD